VRVGKTLKIFRFRSGVPKRVQVSNISEKGQGTPSGPLSLSASGLAVRGFSRSQPASQRGPSNGLCRGAIASSSLENCSF
jgi:hypothetical protein